MNEVRTLQYVSNIQNMDWSFLEHQGPFNPYKPCNYNLYTGINTFFL